MPIPCHCATCGQEYNIDEKLAGKKVKCKTCGRPFAVPVPAPVLQKPDPAEAAGGLSFGGPASARVPAAKPAPRKPPIPKGIKGVYFRLALLNADPRFIAVLSDVVVAADTERG